MPINIINQDNGVKAINYRFAWNTTDISTGVQAGTLPAGAIVLVCRLTIITAFNASGTDFVNVGFGAGGGDLMLQADASQAAGTVIDTTGRALLQSFSSARAVWVRYVGSITAATAGEAQFTLKYLDPQTGTLF